MQRLHDVGPLAPRTVTALGKTSNHILSEISQLRRTAQAAHVRHAPSAIKPAAEAPGCRFCGYTALPVHLRQCRFQLMIARPR